MALRGGRVFVKRTDRSEPSGRFRADINAARGIRRLRRAGRASRRYCEVREESPTVREYNVAMRYLSRKSGTRVPRSRHRRFAPVE